MTSITTMTSLQENVHIIPLGHEYDRAIAPFKKLSIDRVYILSITERTGKYAEKMVARQEFFNKKVIEFFQKKIENKDDVKYLEVELFDLHKVMTQISAIIKAEKGNRIQINMSACGRKTSIGVALAGMSHGADVYYVSAEDYSLTEKEFWEHGISKCEEGKIFKFENFKFGLPGDDSRKILVKLYKEKWENKRERIPSTEIRDFLHDENVEGFEIKLDGIDKSTKTIKNSDGTPLLNFDGTPLLNRDRKTVYQRDKRDETIAQNIKLETKYLRELENDGYIKREKVGREYRISITDSGEYVACISF
ncbi:MAG: DUF6293 family protein [Methanoregula sp.]